MENCRLCGREADWVVTTRTRDGKWKGLELIERPQFIDTVYVCDKHVTEAYKSRDAAVSAQNENDLRFRQESGGMWEPREVRVAMQMEVTVYRSLSGYYAR